LTGDSLLATVLHKLALVNDYAGPERMEWWAVALNSYADFIRVSTGLFFLGTIITGGLLSTGKPMPAAILTIHQITPFLTVFSTAVTLYLLLSRK
jgi:hypothetical protein